jgi:hypothetical protein
LTPVEKFKALKTRLAMLEGQVKGALDEWHDAYKLVRDAELGLIPAGSHHDPLTERWLPAEQLPALRAARAEHHAKLKAEAAAIAARRDVVAQEASNYRVLVNRCEAALKDRGLLEKRREPMPMPEYPAHRPVGRPTRI